MKKRTLLIFLAVLIWMFLIPIGAEADESGVYTVSLTSDIAEKLTPDTSTLAVGETFSVDVMLSGEGVSGYNAYDLTLLYDPAKLTFLPKESYAADSDAKDSAAVITNQIGNIQGKIRIKGFGGEKSFSTPVATLVFETNVVGDADVQLDERNLRIDVDENANNADPMNGLIDHENSKAEASIDGYKVIKADHIQCEPMVVSGDDDVTFTVNEQFGFAYEMKVTVGGKDITDKVTYNAKKGYTIPASEINGKVVIEATPVPMSFTVAIDNGDIVGDKTAQYNTDYIFTLNREEGYRYKIEVTIGGEPFTEFDVEGDVYTIPGEAITGDIKISVNKKDNTPMAAVTFAGAGAKDGSGQKEIKLNVEYPFKVKQKKGYTYSVTVYVDGKRTSYDYDYELDTYYILSENVTGNIVIVIGKIATIEIKEYITLEKKNLYLVVFNGHVNEGEVPLYDGRSMYWSDKYDAYAWLVVSSDTVKKAKTTAEKNIGIHPGKPAGNIDYSGNVDKNLRIDKADAKLVREMYEGKHSLDFMEMNKLLSADVYGDKVLNMRDVLTVVSKIS